MWKYGNNPTESDFEKKLDYVESLLAEYGAERTELNKRNRERFGQRPTYLFNGEYYRVDHIFFADKPYIVIEWADEEKLADLGVLEDAEPFPYDLPDSKIRREVCFALDLEPYPESYPDY